MRVVEKVKALELVEAQRRDLEDGECVLCALVRRKPSAELARNEHGTVLVNRFAQRHGHLMVIAHRHVEHIHDLSPTEYGALQRLAYDASVALMRALAPVRVYNALLGSTSPALTVSYAHLHVHVVPIYETDERARPARVFSWSEGVFVYDDDEAEALAAQLRGAWP